MNILAIETSCDETAAAVLQAENSEIKILASIVSSQIALHSQWGGVVPNLAAREHLKNILPVTDQCLKEASLSREQIDLMAVTEGPGLIPALLIGTNSARTLSYLWKKPLLGIHHIEGHIYANFIGLNSKSENRNPKIEFPVLCLVVSGGHTQLVLMKDHLQYEIVGQTQDDAVGEAFDKVARILGLGYPGGPLIAAKAAELRSIHYENKFVTHNSEFKISLPRPMLNSGDFNFSFSGLKTAVLYLVKKNEEKKQDPEFIQAICTEFQQAAIDVLVAKTISAAKKYNPKAVLLAGGVSANQELRQQLERAVKENLINTSYFCPEFKYTIDNAAMIGAAAFFRWQKEKENSKLLENWKNISADANLKINL